MDDGDFITGHLGWGLRLENQAPGRVFVAGGVGAENVKGLARL